MQILIVEDESIIALNLKEQLEALHYSVVGIVMSSVQACVAAATLRPDLVLMDIVLDGQEDGVTAAAWIQEQLGIPIIYVTAYADSETLQRAQVTLPSGYLTKPIRQSDLRANLAMVFYQQQQRRPSLQDDQAQLLGGVSLLLLDSDTVVKALYADFLELFGAQVRTSEAIEEALALLEQAPVDLILSELSFSDGDGQAVVSRVRAHESVLGRFPTPLLAITTQSDPSVLKAAVNAGFTACLVKPVPSEQLKTTVARLVHPS
jgi:CheY-like chemotaxis protein